MLSNNAAVYDFLEEQKRINEYISFDKALDAMDAIWNKK